MVESVIDPTPCEDCPIWNNSFDLGDVDGDGIPDFVSFQDDGIHVKLGTKSGAFGPKFVTPWATTPCPQTAGAKRLADVDGDARSDVVCVEDTFVHVQRADPKNPGRFLNFEQRTRFEWRSAWNIGHRIADVNGDNRADYVNVLSDRICWKLGLGNGFFSSMGCNLLAQPDPLSGKDNGDVALVSEFSKGAQFQAYEFVPAVSKTPGADLLVIGNKTIYVKSSYLKPGLLP